LLLPTMQRDRLVVEPDNPTATLLMVTIDETDDIADCHLIPSETLMRLFSDLDVGTIEVDRGVRKLTSASGW